MRTMIELKPSQAEMLNEISRREGRPVDAFVAEAVDKLLLNKTAEETALSRVAHALETDPEASIGVGENAPPTWEGMDGLEYQRLVRSQ